MYRMRRNFEYGRFERIFVIKKLDFHQWNHPSQKPIDGPNGTAMAIDELGWDPSTGSRFQKRLGKDAV